MNRTNEHIESALDKYADTVRRICFIYLKSDFDVDDIFQDVFLKFMQKDVQFENAEHEKAWIIRVTINRCKDHLKGFWHKNVGSIDEIDISCEDKLQSDLIKVVLSLPQKYRDVIYLFYYEGYTVPQMSKLLGKNENTIYSNLSRARNMLKEKLGESANEYTF